MKKYFDPKEDCQYFVGKTKEIKSIYKSIARKECGIYPRFYGFPVFSEKKEIYALCVDQDGWMTVISSDTMMSLIIDGCAIPDQKQDGSK